MDNRLIILTAALVFVVVAFGVLVASLVRAFRTRRISEFQDEQDAWHAGAMLPTEAVDTNLEGLTLEVAHDSPSAALLTPLRTGDWRPPEEPAPATHLSAASLAERTKGFYPHSSDTPEAPTPPVREVSSHTAPFANLPEVRPAAQAATAIDLPKPVSVVAVQRPEPTPEPAVAPESAPEPEPVVAPVPAPEPEPVVAPMPAPETEPVAAPEPVVAARPRAQAHDIPEGSPSPAGSAGIAHLDGSISPLLAPNEYLEMVAPVEMWFGDYRVGVKAGSKTHAQFLKYADVLLGDLKGTDERIR